MVVVVVVIVVVVVVAKGSLAQKLPIYEQHLSEVTVQ